VNLPNPTNEALGREPELVPDADLELQLAQNRDAWPRLGYSFLMGR